MTPFLVIGYGNELRGDDAVGPCAARRLAEEGWPDVTALAVGQLTPELAAEMQDAAVAVFIDACADEAEGEVRLRRLEAAAGTGGAHGSDPGWLLALTEALFARRPEAWLLTIPATQFELGAPLSTAARNGLSVAVRRVEDLIGAHPSA
jgi:hydrogenase maturation protease